MKPSVVRWRRRFHCLEPSPAPTASTVSLLTHRSLPCARRVQSAALKMKDGARKLGDKTKDTTAVIKQGSVKAFEISKEGTAKVVDVTKETTIKLGDKVKDKRGGKKSEELV